MLPCSSVSVSAMDARRISTTSLASRSVASSRRSILARASVRRIRDSSCRRVMGVESGVWEEEEEERGRARFQNSVWEKKEQKSRFYRNFFKCYSQKNGKVAHLNTVEV